MSRHLKTLAWLICMYVLTMDVISRVMGGTGDMHQIVIACFALVMMKLDDILDLLRQPPAKNGSNALDNSQQFRASLRAAAAFRHRRERDMSRR